MDSVRLAGFVEAVLDEGLPVHGVLVERRGTVVLDAAFHPFGPHDLHDVASVTKSVTGTLVGIAVARGDLAGLDEPVLGFFPGHRIDGKDPRKEAMTLRDLLTMRTGLACHGPPGGDIPTILRMLRSEDRAGFTLGLPMSEDPGTRFRYCSPGSHLLSVIIRAATGRSALDYAREHLFGPVGITRFDWPTDPGTGDPNGWGDLALTRYDMARLGHLYLSGGRWRDRQVVPRDWVRSALVRKARVEPLGPIDGYGYHWWTSSAGLGVAIGRGDQWVVVAPGPGLVVVVTGAGLGETSARKAELVQEFILGAVRSQGPLAPNPRGVSRLQAAVGRAARCPETAPTATMALPPTAGAIAGIPIDLQTNLYGMESATLRFPGAGEARFELIQEGLEPLEVRLGLDGAWRSYRGRRDFPARARGGWEAPDVLRIEVDELGLISRWTVRMRFIGDRVTLGIEDASGNPPVRIEGVFRRDGARGGPAPL